MKKLLTLILICLSITAYSKPGYFVVISENRETKVIKTENVSEVYALLDLLVPGNCIDIDKELSRGRWPVFEIRNGYCEFYVELREIDKKGNYRRIKAKKK